MVEIIRKMKCSSYLPWLKPASPRALSDAHLQHSLPHFVWWCFGAGVGKWCWTGVNGARKGITLAIQKNINRVRKMLMTWFIESMLGSDLTALALFITVLFLCSPSRPLWSILFAHQIEKLIHSSGRDCQGAGELSQSWHRWSGSSLAALILLSPPTETEMIQLCCYPCQILLCFGLWIHRAASPSGADNLEMCCGSSSSAGRRT